MNYKKFLAKSIVPNAIIDLNGDIVFCNNALKLITEVTDKPLEGLNIEEILPQLEIPELDPTADIELEQHYAQTSIFKTLKGNKKLKKISMYTVDIEKDGISSPHFIIGLYDAEARNNQDIEFNQIKRAISEIKDYAFILLDKEGNITNWNVGAQNIKGYSSEEIIGKNFTLFYTAEDVENGLPQGLLKEAELKGRAKSTGWRVKRNGGQFYASVVITAIHDDNGEVIGYSKVTRDLTEQMLMEQKEKELQQKELDQMQNRLIHAEKLISLGNLMAGIAHEINTPIGAIKAAIEVQEQKKFAFKEIIAFTKYLQEEETIFLIDVIKQCADQTEILPSKVERAARRKLSNYLQEKEITNAHELADIMVDLKYLHEEDVEYLMPLLKVENAIELFELIYDFTLQFRNNKTIKIATEKAAKIIHALKVFSRSDNKETFVEGNIIDGLENVLTLYGGELKYGVQLEKNYSCIPKINCLAEQLDQVWTNLISNALHAMKGNGVLTIAIDEQDEFYTVQVKDTGSGIPEEIKPKIFDTFFTTKSGGEGSGLGLNLVRKIIDKHGGKIEVESEPGNTVFTVSLPKPAYQAKHLKVVMDKLNQEN